MEISFFRGGSPSGDWWQHLQSKWQYVSRLGRNVARGLLWESVRIGTEKWNWALRACGRGRRGSNPDWDMCSAEEKQGGRPSTCNWELVWAWVRDFLSSEDVLQVRTTGIKRNIARLYGPFAELFFFAAEKKVRSENPALLPSAPVFDTITANSTSLTMGFLSQGSYGVMGSLKRLCYTLSCVCLDNDNCLMT